MISTRFWAWWSAIWSVAFFVMAFWADGELMVAKFLIGLLYGLQAIEGFDRARIARHLEFVRVWRNGRLIIEHRQSREGVWSQSVWGDR